MGFRLGEEEASGEASTTNAWRAIRRSMHEHEEEQEGGSCHAKDCALCVQFPLVAATLQEGNVDVPNFPVIPWEERHLTMAASAEHNVNDQDKIECAKE